LQSQQRLHRQQVLQGLSAAPLPFRFLLPCCASFVWRNSRAFGLSVLAGLQLLAPALASNVFAKSNSSVAYSSPKSLAIYWKHHGYGADRSIFNLSCRSVLVQNESPGNQKTSATGNVCGPFEISDSLSCIWGLPKQERPLTILPPQIRQNLQNKPPAWCASGNDRITRLSGVIALWNAARYFCPEREMLSSEWNKVLLSALQKAAVDPGEAAYLSTPQKMTPLLKDDQCRIRNNRIEGIGLVSTKYSVDQSWEFVNDKLIMTGCSHALHPHRPVGKSVCQVSAVPLEELVHQHKELISAATPERIMPRIAQDLLLGPLLSTLIFQWRKAVTITAGETYQLQT
jgi:hypothetical protein